MKWVCTKEYVEKGDPEDPEEDYANLYDNSPNYFVVENVTEPVLIITGRRDQSM